MSDTIIQQLAQGSIAQHHAIVDNDHAVGDRFDLFHVMRGVNHGCAIVGQCFNSIQQECARLWIDTDGRFIQ